MRALKAIKAHDASPSLRSSWFYVVLLIWRHVKHRFDSMQRCAMSTDATANDDQIVVVFAAFSRCCHC